MKINVKVMPSEYRLDHGYVTVCPGGAIVHGWQLDPFMDEDIAEASFEPKARQNASNEVEKADYGTIATCNRPANTQGAPHQSSNRNQRKVSSSTKNTAEPISEPYGASGSKRNMAIDTTTPTAMSKYGRKGKTSRSSSISTSWSRNLGDRSEPVSQCTTSTEYETTTDQRISNYGSEQSGMGKGQQKSSAPIADAGISNSEATEPIMDAVPMWFKEMKRFDPIMNEDDWIVWRMRNVEDQEERLFENE